MGINSWFLPTIASLFLYGVWGYWGARASTIIQPLSITFYSSLGVMVAGFFALAMLGFRPELSAKGGTYGLLNGIANGLGCIFFIMALRKGPAIPVILITSMYPFVTLALCWVFLKQGLNMRQGLGMLFAIVAIVLLSTE